MSKQALIVIDLQNDYFPDGKWTLHRVEEAARNAAKLIEAFRARNELVVHIRHEFTSDDAPFFAPGSEGAKIHPSVKPRDGEPVILKHYINSFRETNLKSVLDANAIDQLVICGAMSHMCVDGCTRAAVDFGYPTTVVHDACASRNLEFEGVVVPAEHAHAAFMAALKFGYATTCSTNEFMGQ